MKGKVGREGNLGIKRKYVEGKGLKGKGVWVSKGWMVKGREGS